MRNIIIILLLSIFCNISYAQRNTKEITITGKVLDKKTNQSIPFVHITHQRSNLAVTDQNGDFQFKLYFQAGEKLTRKLRFSFVGYKNFEYVIDTDKPKNISNLIIYLEEDIYQLKAIVIDGKREETSLSIIKKVIANLDKNYTNQSFSYNYLYREVAKDTGAYSRLTEANITTLWRGGYSPESYKTLKVNQLRASEDFSKFKKYMPIIDITLQKNHDWIGQRSMLFNMMNVAKFEFKALEYNQFGKEYLYKIAFTTDKEPYLSCEGNLYISDGDFAVRKIEMEYDPVFIHYAQAYDSLREKEIFYNVYSKYKQVQVFEKQGNTYFMTYHSLYSKNQHVDESQSEEEYENEVLIEHFIDDIQLVTEEEYNTYWVVTEDYKGAEFLNNEPV
nr:carboxypeptidase-like regulatory domain-containing protein [Thermoflexibacter sp.]